MNSDLLTRCFSAQHTPRSLVRPALLILAAVLWTTTVGCQHWPACSLRYNTTVTILQTNYHGWPGSFVIRNSKAEIFVVPKIGRIMQFGFRDEEGVFWENRALDGTPPDWNAKDWINFGGDKTWPSPEADWSKFTKHEGWKPPSAFDGLPAEARLESGDVILSSQPDPHYDIRVFRRIHLDPINPVMTVTTSYERLAGPAAPIGIWIITQLKEPVGVYLPRAKSGPMPNGFIPLMPQPPPSLTIDERLISLTRDKKAAHKIGADAGTLLWVGQNVTLRIDSSRDTTANYPDKGSSAEIYTNPDPLPYVELEMLGPLRNLKPGETIRQVNAYTLARRTEVLPEIEARKLLESK